MSWKPDGRRPTPFIPAALTRTDLINHFNQLIRVRGNDWDLPAAPEKPVEITYHKLATPSLFRRAVDKVQRFFTRRQG